MDETIRSLERAASQGDAAAQERLDRMRARTTAHERLAEVQAEVDARVDALRAAQRRFRDEGLDDFRRYVDAAFAREPGLRAVLIRGYTPEFRDGDLCEHTQSVWVARAHEALAEAGEAVPANELSAEAARALERDLGEFEPVLHARHGTDWQLTLRRGAEGVESDVTPWTAGY